MTNSPTSSVPNTTSRVNHFTGLARKRRRFSLLPANGDGSTLSLDFTTGILDPRLTFTRSTNATFINSNGLVEFAPANRLANSVWSGAGGFTYPTAWGGSISVPTGQTAAGFLTLSGETIRFTSATGASGSFRTWIAQVPTIDSGLTHTLSVQVVGRNANAAMPLSEILAYSGTSTSSKYYINGSDVLPPERGGGSITSATTAWQAGDLLSLVVVGVINGGSIRCGYGVTGGGGQTWSNEWVELTAPQWQPGAVPSRGEYWRNPSTIAQRFDSPRFDYDPTAIGTARGLLIESSAVNYMLESTSLSGYSNSNMVAITSGTETDPEGNANSAKQIYASATTGYHGWYRNVTAGTNTTVTVSIWAKARDYTFLFLSDAASGRAAVRFNLQTGATDNNFGAGYVSARATQYTNGWWRCEMTVSVTASTGYGWTFVGLPTSGATLNAYGAQYTGTGNAADGIYCYGFQVEGGSGASSYIPTGASAGSRGQELLSIGGSNMSWFSNTYTEGTILFRGSITNTASGYTRLFALTQSASIGSATGSVPSLNVGVAASNSNRPFLNAFVLANNNVDIYAPIGAAVTNGVEFGVAAAYKAADWRISSKNLSATSNYANVSTAWGVNLFLSGVNGVSMPAVWYKQFKFFPSRLPDAQMDALSA